jgi:hypothetical protein
MLRWATASPEVDVRVERDCTASAPLPRLIRLIARGIVGHQGPHNGTSERVARLVLPDAAQLGRQQLIAAPCKGVIVEQTCFRLMATTMSS